VDDLDREILVQRLDVAERAHASAMLACSKVEIAWRDAIASGAIDGALFSTRYFRTERALGQATEALADARAALRSASIANAVA
jgi:hypothetical protein